MGHFQAGSNLQATTLLMSRADMQRQLKELLGEHFHHSGELFLPGPTFYKLTTNSDLTRASKELCQWLGVKPGHLSAKFAATDGPVGSRIKNGKTTILINKEYQQNGFEAAAVLVHQVMHFALNQKKRFLLAPDQTNEEFINESIINSGLGLLVLNCLGYPKPLFIRLLIKLHPGLYMIADLYNRQKMTESFLNYINDHQIVYETYSSKLAPWAKKLLPKPIKTLGQPDKRPSVHFQNVQRRVLIERIRITLLGLVSVSVFGFSLYWYAQRPDPIPREIVEQYETIKALEQNYQRCAEKVLQLRRTLDRDDLSAVRIAEAEENRCTSLRNRYDYQVNKYNAALSH